MTNAEKIRQMTDEELREEIYRLQWSAVACPTCYYNKGRTMLDIYLSCNAEGTDEKKRKSPD